MISVLWFSAFSVDEKLVNENENLIESWNLNKNRLSCSQINKNNGINFKTIEEGLFYFMFCIFPRWPRVQALKKVSVFFSLYVAAFRKHNKKMHLSTEQVKKNQAISLSILWTVANDFSRLKNELLHPQICRLCVFPLETPNRPKSAEHDMKNSNQNNKSIWFVCDIHLRFWHARPIDVRTNSQTSSRLFTYWWNTIQYSRRQLLDFKRKKKLNLIARK